MLMKPTIDEGKVMNKIILNLGVLAALVWSVSACTPQVEVSAREPININLNVKIEHEIRVKVDKELDDVFSENKGLF
jgi:hypothetical protein